MSRGLIGFLARFAGGSSHTQCPSPVWGILFAFVLEAKTLGRKPTHDPRVGSEKCWPGLTYMGIQDYLVYARRLNSVSSRASFYSIRRQRDMRPQMDLLRSGESPSQYITSIPVRRICPGGSPVSRKSDQPDSVFGRLQTGLLTI